MHTEIQEENRILTVGVRCKEYVSCFCITSVGQNMKLYTFSINVAFPAKG